MDTNQVTIIIPALNEEGAIHSVVKNLLELLPEAELIVINDGSTDKTAELATDAGAIVVNHDIPCGYGAGLKSGINASTRDFVIFCDGDGQHSPEDVARLIEEVDDYDMVVGERGADSHSPRLRRPGKKILKWFANYLTDRTIPDINSGLRIFRKSAIVPYLHLMPDGFSFSTTSTFAMLKTNRRIKYVPIKVVERVGTSTVRQLKHGPQTIMLMIRLTILFDPLRVFLPLSGISMFFAFLMAAINIIFFRFAIPSTAIFFGLSSVIIFLMGLLTDQVSAIRRESHERT